MQYIASAICLPCLVAITLAYPCAVSAQTEQGAAIPSSPPEASSQAPWKPPRQGEWWERFDFGGKLGSSLATFVGEDATRERVAHAHRPWFMIGGLVNIRLFRWLALQPEVLYLSKGADLLVDGTLVAAFDARYLEFPVLIRVTLPLGEQVNPYLLAGPAIGILRSFKLEDYEDGSITDRTDRVKSIDLGLLGGAGVKLALSRQHAFLIEGRYSRSLSSFSESETEDLKNSVFTFLLGYQYSLSSASP